MDSPMSQVKEALDQVDCSLHNALLEAAVRRDSDLIEGLRASIDDLVDRLSKLKRQADRVRALIADARQVSPTPSAAVYERPRRKIIRDGDPEPAARPDSA